MVNVWGREGGTNTNFTRVLSIHVAFQSHNIYILRVPKITMTKTLSYRSFQWLPFFGLEPCNNFSYPQTENTSSIIPCSLRQRWENGCTPRTSTRNKGKQPKQSTKGRNKKWTHTSHVSYFNQWALMRVSEVKQILNENQNMIAYISWGSWTELNQSSTKTK